MFPAASGPGSAGLFSSQIKSCVKVLIVKVKVLLTQVVDHISLTPLGSVRPWATGIIKHTGIEEEEVQLVRSKLGKCLLHKQLHAPQVRKVKREEMKRVL